MDDKERARKLAEKLQDCVDAVRGDGGIERMIMDDHGVALLAAAFAEVEREALERAAKWHDNLAAQSRKEARQKDEEGWFQKGKDARENARWHEHFAFAIRALPPEPAASVTHSASCNISEKLSDVCSCGADPAAQSSIEYQQQRGVAWDIIDQAINTYDQWMLDDDYDARRVLDEIIDNLRKRRALYRSPEPAGPDPTKALARFFQEWFECGTPNALAIKYGLVQIADRASQLELTDLGYAALRLAEDGT